MRLYNLKETAKILGIHPRTVHRLMRLKKNNLRAINISNGKMKIWRFKDSDIKEFVNKRTYGRTKKVK